MNNALIGRMLGDEKVQEIRDYLREHAPAADSRDSGTSTEEGWKISPVGPMVQGAMDGVSMTGVVSANPV